MKKNYLLSTYNRNILSIAGTHFTSYSPCSFGFTYAFSCPILYRNFSSKEEKGNIKNINDLFDNNQLSLFLEPTASVQRDEIQRFKPNNEFINSLVNVLKDLNKCYLYEFNFSLFLHSNDKNKELIFIPVGSPIDSHLLSSSKGMSDEIKMRMMGMDLLYKMFEFKGYYVFVKNEVDLNLIKDFTKYGNEVIIKLGEHIININESLDEDGFIEFHKPVLLKITRFISERPRDSSSKYTGSGSVLKQNKKYNSFVNQKRSFSQTAIYKDNKNISGFVSSPAYKNLVSFLIKAHINKNSQIEMENFLWRQWDNINTEKKDNIIDYNILNEGVVKIIKSEVSNLDKLISNFKLEYLNLEYKDSLTQNVKTSIVLNIILNNIKNEEIISLLLGRILRLLSSASEINFNTQCTNVFYELGSDIVNMYLYSLYTSYKTTNLSVKADKELQIKNTFYEWKTDNKSIVEKYSDTTLLVQLGGRLVQFLMDIKLVEVKTVNSDKNEKVSILTLTSKLDIHKDINKIYHIPYKIPMIVRPKQWSKINNKEILGGYLLNGESYSENLIIKKWSTRDESKILDSNVIYNFINNINSIGYKVNKEVLNFIISNNNKYNFYTEPNHIHPLTLKTKLTKKEKTKLESFNSTRSLEQNILGLALAFSYLPMFYIPSRLDARGRIYCESQYLNYQSTELAKSLLLFANPEKLYKTDTIAINYFKIYGANCYGNGLDKTSFKKRIEWIDENLENILNIMQDHKTPNSLIEKAENKPMFLAFCIEYSKFINSLNNDSTYFLTYLPIQLDASCNGYQHLALLCADVNLMKELNLTKSDFETEPKDFYSFLTLKVKEYIIHEVNENKENLDTETLESYKRLIDLDIKRSIIKKAVMTIVYNVSFDSMLKYMKESFELLDDYFKHKDNNDVVLKKEDFINLARGLLLVLYRDFPKLKKLMIYLKQIAYICSELNMPIPWTLPTGLVVKQSYLESNEVRIKPFSYMKNTFVLNILDKNKFNRRKQMNAFMPNLIHSLDAASLALFGDLFLKKDNENQIKNFYSIHDCFGVTANNVQILLDELKSTYIFIYCKDNYLEKLDKEIINSIKNMFGEKQFDDEKQTVTHSDGRVFKYPEIKDVIGNKVDKNFILKSSYILH